MKKMERKETANKGFSLVELIIVIAIMAVLVGILAPQFMKYVEQSRRSTDIQNAQSLATAYLADIADGKITADVTTATAVIDSNRPDAFSETPVPKGSIVPAAAQNFTYVLNVTDGTVKVYAAGYELYPGAEADTYKTATAAK